MGMDRRAILAENKREWNSLFQEGKGLGSRVRDPLCQLGHVSSIDNIFRFDKKTLVLLK